MLFHNNRNAIILLLVGWLIIPRQMVYYGLMSFEKPFINNPVEQKEPSLEKVAQEVAFQAKEIPISKRDRAEDGSLLAIPHGPQSKLTEPEWKAVRTEAFKGWFGDWENIPISQFKTSKGSIYSYDAEGKTTRFKTVTGEQHERQDITVFIRLSPQHEQDFLQAVHIPGHGKVRVLERLKDSTPKVIKDINDIEDKDALYLAIIKDNQVIELVPAITRPMNGYSVFDARSFEKDGERFTERHIGNDVDGIKYGSSSISKALSNGEPLLVGDPADPDPDVRIAIKTVNPYLISKTEWIQWMDKNQLSNVSNGDEIARNRLREAGYDGLIVDGMPWMGKDKKPYFESSQMLKVRLSELKGS
ncbi:MAG: hypothetical protein K0S20_570 [Patescibacteria group bacterium]|nr:hypothetical protein [Patescibacteria group bacterium]